MKKSKLTKSIALFLIILGMALLSGCHQNQIPVDDPDEPNTGEVDCDKNPEHEDCKDDDDEKYPFSLGFTLYELEDKDGVSLNAYAVGKYKGEDTVVKIPSTFKDKPVIKISDNTFDSNTKITKVIIPDSIKALGKNVFAKCTSLQEVVFEGVSLIEEIPANTFYKCKALKSITIPPAVKRIGEYAFYQCTNITELRIPIKVTAIGRSAFGAMTSLTRLSVPFIGGGKVDSEEADVLGFVFDTTFYEYTTQISQKLSDSNSKTYFIPTSLKTIELLQSSVTSFGYGALSGVSTVETLIIPANYQKIGDNAFADFTGLNNILFRGSEDDWANVNGQYDAENKETLKGVKLTYNYEGN